MFGDKMQISWTDWRRKYDSWICQIRYFIMSLLLVRMTCISSGEQYRAIFAFLFRNECQIWYAVHVSGYNLVNKCCFHGDEFELSKTLTFRFKWFIYIETRFVVVTVIIFLCLASTVQAVLLKNVKNAFW